MRKLVEGVRQFQHRVFSSKQQMFGSLADGQHPLALFITCSDSRIDPNLLTQTEPGELFVLRNAGNIVPPYEALRGGEAATIEYAVAVLKVKHIIVCGHSHCGAMSSLVNHVPLDKLPAVRAWLSHAECTQRMIDKICRKPSGAENRLTAAIEENVLAQLKNLRTHPAVAAGLARDELKCHGWVYEFETGRVFAYQPQQRHFILLEEMALEPEHPVPQRPAS